MNKIISAFFALFILIGLVSCTDSDDQLYDGAPLINFNNGTSTKSLLVVGEGDVTRTIQYGTVRPVTGNHSVSLVVDTQNSTAVQGTDFEIVKGTDDLVSGETNGTFEVKFKESGAVVAGKKVVFTLASSTLDKAAFDQTYTVEVGLTCPLSYFEGPFNLTESWWTSPNTIYDIEESTVPNQILVKGFWDNGSDMVLNFDPSTNVITIPEQWTGYNYQGNPAQPVNARPATGGLISTIDLCNRTVTLNINYWVPALSAGYGNKVEKFVGL